MAYHPVIRQGPFVSRNAGNKHGRLFGRQSADIEVVQRAKTDASLLDRCQVGLKIRVTAPCAFNRGDIGKIYPRCCKLCPLRLAVALVHDNALHGIFFA